MGQRQSTKKDSMVAAYQRVLHENIALREKLIDITTAIQEYKSKCNERQRRISYDDPVDAEFEKPLSTLDTKREELHKFRTYLNHNMDIILDSEEFTEELCFGELLAIIGVNYCKVNLDRTPNPPAYTQEEKQN